MAEPRASFSGQQMYDRLIFIFLFENEHNSVVMKVRGTILRYKSKRRINSEVFGGTRVCRREKYA